MSPPLLLLHLNAVAGIASAAVAVVALRDPGKLSHTPPTLISTGETFYRNLFAVRALPFGILIAGAPYYYRHVLGLVGETTDGEMVLGWLVGTAAVVQATDVVLAVQMGEAGVVVGAGLATAVHFITASFYL